MVFWKEWLKYDDGEKPESVENHRVGRES
jgi:hypothetical protein